MKKSIFYSLILVILFSCSSAQKPKELFLKSAHKGEIIDNVTCKTAPDQSYCLYLPSTYSLDKVYPVIYAFDPHGDGHLPVALMKNQAEKLGYILIGSNNSKNGLGLQDINYIVSSMLYDSKQKLSIDSTRIYLVGFSGGARIACGIAQSFVGINGVIACSGGFQFQNTAPGFNFIGITATKDMNYLEMKKLNDNLEKINAPCQFFVGDGKHEWPSEAIINEALNMLELYAMKNKLTPVKTDFINAILFNNIKYAENLKQNNSIDSLMKAHSILKRTLRILTDMTDVSNLKTTFNNLNLKPEVQVYLNEQASLEILEAQKQKEFQAAWETKNGEWWNAEIKKLNEAGKSTNNLQKDLAKRLSGYISLSCYSYSFRALSVQNWKIAETFTTIYRTVDPDNSDSYYATACLYANTNRKKEAVLMLQKAIKCGFNNKAKLQQDPLLNPLHDLPDFDNLIK